MKFGHRINHGGTEAQRGGIIAAKRHKKTQKGTGKFNHEILETLETKETRTGTVRQPAGEDVCPTGKGFWLHSVMGRRGDALRLVLADTAALRKFIRVNPAKRNIYE